MSYVEDHMAESLSKNWLEPIKGGDDVTGFYMKKYKDSRIMSTLILFTKEGIVITGDLAPGDHGVISCLGYGLGWFRSELSERYLCEKFLKQGWHQECAINEIKDMIECVRKGEYDRYSWSGIETAYDERAAIHDDILDSRRGLRESLAGDEDKEDIKAQRAELNKLREGFREARVKLVEAREAFIGKLETVIRDTEYGEGDQSGFYHQWTDEINEDVEGLPGWDYEPAEAGWLCAIQQRFAKAYEEYEKGVKPSGNGDSTTEAKAPEKV